jgi:hypothetical protein
MSDTPSQTPEPCDSCKGLGWWNVPNGAKVTDLDTGESHLTSGFRVVCDHPPYTPKGTP